MSDEPNNITKLLGVFVEPVQGIEDALQQLFSERTVDTSVGAQLDVVGRWVGEPRNGRVDDVYRRFVRARISVNNSDANINDVLTVTDLIVNDPAAYYRVINWGVAAFVMRVEDVVLLEVANYLLYFLRPTVAAGVRVIVESWPLVESALFTFDGVGVVGLGFGDSLTPATGGGLASAIS